MTRGFTLIELLATSALAALLMLAMLTVTASVGRSRADFARRQSADSWAAGVSDVLRWDLQNSRTVDIDAGGLRLTGYASIDPRTHSPTHLPCEVRYAVRRAGKSAWLVRQQRLLSPNSAAGLQNSLVCGNVAALTLEPVGDASKVEDKTPPAIRLTLRSTAPGAAPLVQVLQPPGG